MAEYNSKNKLNNSDVGWNASTLFYIYLNDLDLEYKDAYFINNWDKMYKVFKLKYTKVRTFISKHMSSEQKNIIEDDNVILSHLSEMKEGDNDYSNQWNNNIVNELIKSIESKMMLIDELMSEAGMYILLVKQIKDRPGALGGDDFTID